MCVVGSVYIPTDYKLTKLVDCNKHIIFSVGKVVDSVVGYGKEGEDLIIGCVRDYEEVFNLKGAVVRIGSGLLNK